VSTSAAWCRAAPPHVASVARSQRCVLVPVTRGCTRTAPCETAGCREDWPHCLPSYIHVAAAAVVVVVVVVV